MCNLSDWVEERGAELKLVQLVVKKLKKSDTVAQIADALEETEEKIGHIVEVAQMYAPEYDEREILYHCLGQAGAPAVKTAHK